MNKELIDKLAKQAGAEDFYGGMECMDIEKFAELIVRECAVFAYHSADKEAMKKHFGVEV